MERSTFRIIILLLIMLSAISILIGLSGNYWISAAGEHSGLWKSCQDNQECIDLDYFWLPAVRGFLMIGLTFLGFSLLYFIAMIVRPRSFGSLCMSVFIGISGVSVLAGLSVYTYFNMDLLTDSFRYHWTFFVGWAGLFLSIAATAMACFDARRPSSPYEQAIRLD